VAESIQSEITTLTTQAHEIARGTDVGVMNKAGDKLAAALDKHLAAYRKPAWRESLESIAVAVLVALLLRSFVVEAFKIPSGSMIPTLAIGDQIFVNKLVYGVRVPFTAIRIIDLAMPKRGEVIVFICPVEPHEDYIKRVIGLPGDEIMVRDGVVSINGQPSSAPSSSAPSSGTGTAAPGAGTRSRPSSTRRPSPGWITRSSSTRTRRSRPPTSARWSCRRGTCS